VSLAGRAKRCTLPPHEGTDIGAGSTLQVDPDLGLAKGKRTERIRQLKDKARPLIPVGNNLSADEITLREIAAGKITATSFPAR
jgi:hypothetical protein